MWILINFNEHEWALIIRPPCWVPRNWKLLFCRTETHSQTILSWSVTLFFHRNKRKRLHDNRGQHSLPSLKLTFPFLFNLHDVQSTSDFKSTSKKQTFQCAENIQIRRAKLGDPMSWARIDWFSLHIPITTRLRRQAPGKSNFLEYWHSGTQQNK